MRKYLFNITAIFSLHLSIPSIAFLNNLSGLLVLIFLNWAQEQEN
jgi:hypothetical protein